MQFCLLLLVLLQTCSWSYSVPTTSTPPVKIATTGITIPARCRNTIVQSFDVESNSYCIADGSTSVHVNWQVLHIVAHSNYAAGCGQKYIRSLLTLDEIDALPRNAFIKSARIKLFGTIDFEVYSLLGEPDVTNEVLIKRILTPWNANTVTWVTQPKTTNVNAAVIPSTKPTFPQIADNIELYNFTIDITQLVRDIQASERGHNHGIMFQMKYEWRYRTMIFCSFNHPDVQRHPQIIIDI